MERGWSIKDLHRLIVNSATYRQSSKVTPELFARDQYNRLLARAPRLRVEGEIVRDIALHASGLLEPEGRRAEPVLAGPGVPVRAAGQLRAVQLDRGQGTGPLPPGAVHVPPPVDAVPGVHQLRRAQRRLVVRQARPRSNTPLQALTSLNETVFMDCARALAVRALTEGGKTDDERIAFAFRCCTSRPPTDDERPSC